MLEEKVFDTIKKYNMINENDNNVLVAVSGGFDSTCLLYILNSLKEKLNINLLVAHINHGLRKNANIDEEYVTSICKELHVPIFAKKFDVKKIAEEEKLSIEMAGRNVRYDFFEKIANENNCSKIAIAHNANDNAETILLNMFRGTGLGGLKGIKKVRNRYIRPLIETTRKEINEYLNKNSIIARLDETNNESEYKRNIVRNELIPLIEKNFNSNILNSLNKMSDILIQEDEYINSIVEKKYEDCLIEQNNEEIILSTKKMLSEDIVIQKRLILKSFEKLNGTTFNIEEVHVNDILKMIKNNVGNKMTKPNKDMLVFINKGKIHFTNKV